MNEFPSPPYRYGAPSAPWPWPDTRDNILFKDDAERLFPHRLLPIHLLCDHTSCGGCWKTYPVPYYLLNRLKDPPVPASGGVVVGRHYSSCTLYHFTLFSNGLFTVVGNVLLSEEHAGATWDTMLRMIRSGNAKVHVLSIAAMDKFALQMLGARFRIEPSFFFSCLNWIPSRSQEGVIPGNRDCITISLRFLKFKDLSDVTVGVPAYTPRRRKALVVGTITEVDEPVGLGSDHRVLVTHFISAYLIRRGHGSSIILYCPPYNGSDQDTPTAYPVPEYIRLAGRNPHWQAILKNSSDPTFILVIVLWYVMYGWDEAFEELGKHISWLEGRLIKDSNLHDVRVAEWSTLRVHLLHYSTLLQDFRNAVEFVQSTKHPAMHSLDRIDNTDGAELMGRECNYLLAEINRLEVHRKSYDERVQHLMNVGFNVMLSMDTRKLSQATFRDSASMKQIAYLTMIFLPGSFVAAVFGMNIKTFAPDTEGTLVQYLGTAIGLTLATAFVLIFLKARNYL